MSFLHANVKINKQKYAETTTALQSNYPPIKKKKRKLNLEARRESITCDDSWGQQEEVRLHLAQQEFSQ